METFMFIVYIILFKRFSINALYEKQTVFGALEGKSPQGFSSA